MGYPSLPATPVASVVGNLPRNGIPPYVFSGRIIFAALVHEYVGGCVVGDETDRKLSNAGIHLLDHSCVKQFIGLSHAMSNGLCTMSKSAHTTAS